MFCLAPFITWSPQRTYDGNVFTNKLCVLGGHKAFKERQWRNWLIKFRSGDFSFQDESRSGWSSEVDDNQVTALIELNCHVSQHGMGQKLNLPNLFIIYNIKKTFT